MLCDPLSSCTYGTVPLDSEYAYLLLVRYHSIRTVHVHHTVASVLQRTNRVLAVLLSVDNSGPCGPDVFPVLSILFYDTAAS